MMVRRHQFQVYLTLTKSCIYARNHTLRTPPTWKKTPRKKSLPKATKRLEINTPSKGICKGKNHQQKQKFTKAKHIERINVFVFFISYIHFCCFVYNIYDLCVLGGVLSVLFLRGVLSVLLFKRVLSSKCRVPKYNLLVYFFQRGF